jgi:hypothetical protein
MSAPEDDRRFSERVGAAFAPPPMTPERAAAFDRALEARRARRVRWTWPVLVPALAGAAAALWFAVRPAPEPAPAPPPAALASAGEPALAADPLDWIEEDDPAAALPPDYLQLAMIAELEPETTEEMP